MTEPPTICLTTREVRDLIDRSVPGCSEEELGALLDRARGEGRLNGFFANHLFAYNVYLELRDYGRCVSECEGLLDQIRRIRSEDEYHALHKGTPFYWLGASLFIVGDYERAIFYMDAAVSEDIRTNGGSDPRPNTPAIRFMTLDDREWHAAAPLLKRLKDRIKTSLDTYNGIYPRTCQQMTLERVIERFIRPLALDSQHPGRRSLPTAFLSFFAEWDDRETLMARRSDAGTSEPFFMHLFKGCLLFESLLKANTLKKIPDPQPRKHNTLGTVLQCLFRNLDIDHATPTSADSFNEVLDLVQREDRTVQSVIEHTAKARNTLGHNLGWEIGGLDSTTYSRLAENIASACLHAIACLYVPESPPAAQ